MSLAALFRTDRAFSDVATEFGDSALIAAVADHLIGYPPPKTSARQPPVETSPWLNVHTSTMTTNPSAMVSQYSVLNREQVRLNAEITNLAEHEIHLKNDKVNLTKRNEDLGKVVEARNAADTKGKEAEAAKATADQKAKEAAEATEPADKEKKTKEAAMAKETAENKAKEAKEAKSAAEKKAKDINTTLDDLNLDLENLRMQFQTTEGDLSQILVHRANAAKVTAVSDTEIKQFATGTIDGSKAADLLQAEYLNTALVQKGSYLVFLHINLASGTNLTHRNILTNSLRVSGGASASYHALNSNCQTVAAGTVYSYSGFYKVPTTSRGYLPSSSMEPEHGEQFPQEWNGQGKSRIRTGHPGRR